MPQSLYGKCIKIEPFALNKPCVQKRVLSKKAQVATRQACQRSSETYGQRENHNTSLSRQIRRDLAVHKKFKCQIPKVILVRSVLKHFLIFWI